MNSPQGNNRGDSGRARGAGGLRLTRVVPALAGALLVASAEVARADEPKPPITAALALWLRADAGVSTAKGTDLVTTWADQTSKARGIGDKAAQDASAPSAAARPRLVAGALAGKPVVRFDGKDDRLGFKLPVNGRGRLTVFLVAANTAKQEPGWAAHQHLALGWTYTGHWGIYGLSAFQDTVAARFATAACAGAAVHCRAASLGSGFSVTASRKNGTRHGLFVNGRKVWSCIGGAPVIRNTSDAGAIGGGIFGAPAAAGYYQGDVAEVLVYTAALSDGDRQAVERYLSEKWLRERDASGKGNRAVKPPEPGEQAK